MCLDSLAPAPGSLPADGAEEVEIELPESLSSEHRRIALASSFLKALGEEAAEEIANGMQVQRVAPAEALFEIGDIGSELYVVLEGRLEVFRSDRYGRARTLEILGPGEVVGELSLFGGASRTASVSALAGGATVSCVPYPMVRRILASHTDAALRLLGHESERLRRANMVIADLTLLSVRARVFKAVLELAKRFGQPAGDGVLVEHGLSQDDLARYVGSSREMVNRALSELQNQGVLAVRPRCVLLSPRFSGALAGTLSRERASTGSSGSHPTSSPTGLSPLSAQVN